MKNMGKYERWIKLAVLKSPKAVMEAAYIDTGWVSFKYQALSMYVGYSEKLVGLA